MSDTFGIGMFDLDLDVPCPACGYLVWVRTVEVVVGTTVTCSACRCRIRLVDEAGSVRNAAVEIDDAMRDLNDTLNGLFS